jgi:hypothetical protein
MQLRGRSSDSLTLDRKDPRLGYANGNLQVIPNADNVRKAAVDRRLYGWSWSVEIDKANVPF